MLTEDPEDEYGPPVEAEINNDNISPLDIGEESDPLESGPSSGDEARDDIFGASIDEIIAGPKWGSKPKKRYSKGIGPYRRRRKSDVPNHLNGLMGNATVAFIAKDYTKATEILNHIINTAPKAAAPHRTLALIYEEQGNKEKALETYMVAAEIDKSDPDLWKRNSALWIEQGDTDNAIYCLTMSIKASHSSDPEALRARGDLYFQKRSFKKAAENYVKLSKILPYDIEVARLILTSLKKGFAEGRAYEPIEQMMRACEYKLHGRQKRDKDLPAGLETTVDEMVQALVNIRLSQKRYDEASSLLTRIQHRGAISGRPLTFTQRLMMAICQERQGSTAMATPMILEFLASPAMIEKHPRLLSEVADACKEAGDYGKAIRAYALLLELADDDDNDEYDKGQIYMNRAICYKNMNNAQATQDDLQSVLMIDPKNLKAGLMLQEYLPAGVKFDPSSGLRKKARKKTDPSGLTFRQRQLAFHRDREQAGQILEDADRLFDQGDYEGYLSRVYNALNTALQLEEVRKAFGMEEYFNESSGMEARWDGNNVLSAIGHGKLPQDPKEICKWDERNLSSVERESLEAIGACIMQGVEGEEFVDIASRILTSFYHIRQMHLAYPITKLFFSINHLRVRSREPRIKLRRLDMLASIATGDLANGYEQVRCMLTECPENAVIVYAYFLIEQMWTCESDAQRANSFRCVTRLSKKAPHSIYLALVSGACSSRGGLNIRTYTTGVYLHAFKLIPHHPLVALCLSIQMTYVGMSRKVSNRNEALMYAFGFLDDYRHNRMEHAEEGEEVWRQMEIDYNTGRMFHQLGITHMAVNMYHRVLDADVDDEFPEWADLRMDAAYNLIQIYDISDSGELATAICDKYLQF